MLFVTIPHSGEKIPAQAPWLLNLDALTLLTDVDRFVQELYRPVCEAQGIPMIVAPYHRYAVDLNRVPTDVDSSLVKDLPAGQNTLAGSFVSGFHWARTTKGTQIMTAPMDLQTHRALIKNIYDPFHAEVAAVEARIIQQHGLPRYHLDLHSMPSQGTSAHKDAGAKRPDIVVSDCEGASSSKKFVDDIMAAYRSEGFAVAYNWPYKGGRMTQNYGRPAEGRNSVQIELNRALYMSEVTREKSVEFSATALRLGNALKRIFELLKQDAKS